MEALFKLQSTHQLPGSKEDVGFDVAYGQKLANEVSSERYMHNRRVVDTEMGKS